MSQKLYMQAKKFIVDSFTKSGKKHQILHFKRTVYWIKRLKPSADEALLISAIAHDVERAFRKKDVEEKKDSVGYAHAGFFRLHEERGAKIIADFLLSKGASQNLIRRVKMLVSRHEEGGNNDQNLLKDADSISFFENNVARFIEKIPTETSREKVKDKFDWMFRRITSKTAKKICQPLYIGAIKKLGY